MARISDKHGLTNKYREKGHKRLVKRGRPRTSLFGSSVKKSKKVNVDDSPLLTLTVCFGLLAVVFCVAAYFIPFLIPVIVFPLVIGCGDKILKKVWNLPSGRGSKLASFGWFLLSSLEMAISFCCVIANVVFEESISYLIISLVVYIILSVILLWSKHKKILSNK